MKKIILTESQLKKLISEQETSGISSETTPTNTVPTPVQDVDEDIAMLDNLFTKD